MQCPICCKTDTKVIDSRLSSDGLGIRRRRECEKCSYRFSTVEGVEILDLKVIKRDGSRDSYSSEKMALGLRKALEKRPYTAESFQKLVGEIERDIQRTRKDEITSQEIGEIVMDRLRHFDQVAYIRFASVYRSFEDVDSFAKELKNLLSPKKSARRKGK